ncbi:MAG TPA: alpha/beta hydrolase [Chryseosolibacter sp.]|nr:alpha/beta hydrolase [Chryseosolibacter sp.]
MSLRRSVRITFPFILIAAIYFVGSTPEKPRYNTALPHVSAGSVDLENLVTENESRHNLKPDNHARIVWADSAHTKTEFAIVYLHGFSASQKEGDPVHIRFAREFGCNLYLSRLADHGIDTTESLLYFTADRIWESAKQALAIGNNLGKKVILMSTSTGGTVALKLAAEYPDKVHALINLSPNIAINNPAAFLLNDPWGLHIARMVMGGKYRETGANNEKSQYWNNKYRLESVVELQELVETTMTNSTFERIHQPTLTLYYYKNEDEQDPEVKVSAMLEMHDRLSTPADMKVAKAIPTAGAHVIGGSLVSKDVESVYREIREFATQKLAIKPTGMILVQN